MAREWESGGLFAVLLCSDPCEHIPCSTTSKSRPGFCDKEQIHGVALMVQILASNIFTSCNVTSDTLNFLALISSPTK